MDILASGDDPSEPIPVDVDPLPVSAALSRPEGSAELGDPPEHIVREVRELVRLSDPDFDADRGAGSRGAVDGNPGASGGGHPAPPGVVDPSDLFPDWDNGAGGIGM